MTAVGTHLVLLDPANEHGRFHEHLEHEILSRFTDTDCWLKYMTSAQNTPLLHLFLRDAESHNIGPNSLQSRNLKFYISCANEDKMEHVKKNHTQSMLLKIFKAPEFPIHLYQAAMECLWDQRQNATDDSGKADALLICIVRISKLMGEEAVRHMEIKVGRQPEDRR